MTGLRRHVFPRPFQRFEFLNPDTILNDYDALGSVSYK